MHLSLGIWLQFLGYSLKLRYRYIYFLLINLFFAGLLKVLNLLRPWKSGSMIKREYLPDRATHCVRKGITHAGLHPNTLIHRVKS